MDAPAGAMKKVGSKTLLMIQLFGLVFGFAGNINAQLLTINAAVTKKREDIYMAAMLEPHTAAELSIDEIKAMVDELIEAHGEYMKDYK